MHPVWARSLRDQCLEAGVAFNFKQWGAHAPETEPELETSGTGVAITPEGEQLGAGCKWGGILDPDYKKKGGVWMSQIGKKKAGRKLDGKIWDEYPKEAVSA